MDMVNNHIPTFEKKAEALHYFPMFRTWFGLQGLCKLPWNDIEPADNAKHAEPNKVPEHVAELRRDLHRHHRRDASTKEELILQSERVYNFQRVFNLRLGHGKRAEDYPPYRAMGPVTSRRVRVARRALRQADEGEDRHRSRGQEHRGKDQAYCASTAKRSTRA